MARVVGEERIEGNALLFSECKTSEQILSDLHANVLNACTISQPSSGHELQAAARWLSKLHGALSASGMQQCDVECLLALPRKSRPCRVLRHVQHFGGKVRAGTTLHSLSFNSTDRGALAHVLRVQRVL
jgi:hypothetical protein